MTVVYRRTVWYNNVEKLTRPETAEIRQRRPPGIAYRPCIPEKAALPVLVIWET